MGEINFSQYLGRSQRRIRKKSLHGKGESVDKIAEDLLEDIDIVEKFYNVLNEHPEKDRDEIYDFLME